MIITARKDFLKVRKGDRLDVTDHRGRQLIQRGLAQEVHAARPTMAPGPTGFRTGAEISPSLSPRAKAPGAKTSRPRAAKPG